jgi:hypothetical protein
MSYVRSEFQNNMVAFLEGSAIGHRQAELTMFHSYDETNARDQALTESEAIGITWELTSETGPLYREGVKYGIDLVIQSLVKYEVVHV